MAKIIASELLSYTYSRAVRKEATKTIVFLLNACEDSNHMSALFQHIYPSLKARIETMLKKYDCK